jgi:DNA-3-methyladenine glycosylase I
VSGRHAREVRYPPAMATRCPWAGDDPLMVAYHDEEWGVPVHDDRLHFEFMVLEGAQAGLSWRTILHKREGYRRAFAGFDPAAVAAFDEARVEQLLADASIVRNRLKVAGAVRNARAFLAVRREAGSFSEFFWSFVGGRPTVHAWTGLDQVPAKTAAAEAASRALRERGFTFVGPTIVYSHMQACGLVNDHLVGCYRHREVGTLRR